MEKSGDPKMKTSPTRDQGHLIVAAVRVLRHRDGRGPTVDAVAHLLQLPPEEVGHLTRALEAAGVLRMTKSAYDLRMEVADHTLIESLPAAGEGPTMQDEVSAFRDRFRERQSNIEHLFGEDPAARQKKRLGKLDDELKKWKKTTKLRPPEAGDDE
jgi:hypothetical protein